MYGVLSVMKHLVKLIYDIASNRKIKVTVAPGSGGGSD